MIGLVLLYFIGKYFYEIANEFNKKKWAYIILGLVVYYASMFAFGLILGVLDVTLDTGILELPGVAIDLISIPFGLLGCWILYDQLKKAWSREQPNYASEDQSIHDFGKSEADENFES